MKANKKTIAGILLGIVATAITTVIVKRATKKEEAKLVEQRKQEDQEIEELGVSPERMRSQVSECEREADRNMVKAMYVGIESNLPDGDKNVIDIDAALRSKSLLHITEDQGNRGNKYLNFLFEIPDLSGTLGYNDPRLGDYFVALKQLKEHLWANIVRYCNEPRGYMAVYLAYSYKNPKKSEEDYPLVSEVLEIPKSVWSKWADEHDGVIEFFNDAEENGILPVCKKKGVWEIIDDLLTTDIASKNPGVELSTISPRPEELRLMYKISFREALKPGDFGVDVKTALDCLKYIYDEFSVTRKGSSKGGVVYNRFMFHAPNDDGIFDSLTRYYTTKGGEVVHDSYSYPEDDEEVDYSKTNNVFNAAKHAAIEKHHLN